MRGVKEALGEDFWFLILAAAIFVTLMLGGLIFGFPNFVPR